MKKKLILNYVSEFELKFYLSLNLNIFFIKGFFGIFFVRLPRIFFFKELNIIFLNKNFFFSFWNQFLLIYRIFLKIYFFRIKLKGLGYRIKKLSNRIYRFFVAYNHYFYFFAPFNVYIWNKKRNLLIVSKDKLKLNNIFNQLLLVKKLDFFERTNSFISPKKIVYIKK